MRGKKNGKGGVGKKGTGAITDMVGQIDIRGSAGDMSLSLENGRPPRPSCARLRDPPREIFDPTRVPTTPTIDVTRYLQLARSAARSFYRHHARGWEIDLDDLAAEACLILVRAAAQFDPSRGTTFSSYALRAIWYGYIRLLRCHRKNHSLIVADVRMREAEARPMPDPDAAIDVPTLLARLSPRERDVVEKWFGLNNGESWKVKRLAERHQTSCDGVRRVLERALAILRCRVRVADWGTVNRCGQ